MATKYSVGLMCLLAGAASAAPAPAAALSVLPLTKSSLDSTAAASTPKLPLYPISNGAQGNGVGRSVVPKKNLNLAWQTPNNDSVVSVGLVMHNKAVVLEDIDDVIAVDCTGNKSVAVTFNNTAAFDEAVSAWTALEDNFIMVTNHLGDCDTELERSFFVADTSNLASFESNLTIIAQAEKSDVASTAKSTEIDFQNTVPATGVQKRGINWGDDGLTVAYNYSIPKEQTIVNTDYVSVYLHDAEVVNSITYGGHITWELFKGVTEFTLDIEKHLWHHANMTFVLNSPISKTWTWSPDVLSYAVVDIPGIFSLGPAAGVDFGGTITTSAGVSITTDFTSTMANGTIHLDFINWNESYTEGWKTEHEASYNITEDVGVTLKPFMDVYVEFACNLFSGLIDLSTGVKAKPSFPFTTTASWAQIVASNNTMTNPNSTSSTACANGLKEEVDFQFDIIAFATKWVSITLYEYKVPIWDTCLHWADLRRH